MTFDHQEITAALKAWFRPGEVFEVRALEATTKQWNTRPHTEAGYFDLEHLPDLLRSLDTLTAYKGIYVTLNPLTPAVLGRARYVFKHDKLIGAKDEEVLCRRWLPIDCDAKRVSGVPSSEDEHAHALAKARDIRDGFASMGWPDSIFIDSGNGAQLLYRLPDLPLGSDLVKRTLEALQPCSDDHVEIDQTVFNPARIWRLPGTLNRKGDPCPEQLRHHRPSRVLVLPAADVVVPLHTLEASMPRSVEAPKTIETSSFSLTAGIVTNAPGAFGVAWRVLDAQYTRVASFPRAVPQRRRRLILVGYLGDWRRAAQVFFDGDLRSRDTPPRRTTRAAPAGDSAPGAGSGCLRMRSGKEGGGKGALVGEELSHTLATGNDQVCFDLREGGNTASNLSPALLATDHKGGKAVSFFPRFLGKGTAPTEECCGTLINAGAPGHSNAVVLFDNHNGSRFSEQTEAANAVIAHYGTGGNNTPLVLNEAFGFQKNDAGGYRIPEQKEVSPTLRVGGRPSVAIAENIIGRKAEQGGNGLGVHEEVGYTLNASDVHGVAYLKPPHGIVRRLLPVECERLQGMPDHYTQIAWKGKPAEACPDGARYKAIGNSMAVNVMRWVGERIQRVEEDINGNG